MQLVFVRHAQSVANAERRIQGHADYALSDQGRTQAASLHRRFEQEGFSPTHLYSSPLKRCAQTAEIATGDGVPEYWDDLIEHDMGKLSTLSIDEADAKYPDLVWSRPSDPAIGIEPPATRRVRAARVLARLVSDHGNDDIVLSVSHGGILQSIMAEILGTERTWGVAVHNTAIFDLSLDKDLWSLDGSESLDDALDTTLWRINRYNDAAHIV